MTDAGYVEFNGDVPSRTCSFKVPQDADYEAKLAALAKTNGHIKGYTIQ